MKSTPQGVEELMRLLKSGPWPNEGMVARSLKWQNTSKGKAKKNVDPVFRRVDLVDSKYTRAAVQDR